MAMITPSFLSLRPAPSSSLYPALLSSSPLRSRRRRMLISAVHVPESPARASAGAAEEGFVEVGYVSGAHGLKGEVRVVPTTGFPELRFGKPGKRWLRAQIGGTQVVREVDLVEGYPGQKSWIVSFDGIHSVEEAKQIVGSTLLVENDDRPELEEGEFYSRDLVGMRIILKKSGQPIGTVSNVYNFGAGDLLKVLLDSSEDTTDLHKIKDQSSTSTGVHVWVPFVQEIVPDVDMESREMWITPPKGLLELNIRSDPRPKKQRRLMVRNGRIERSCNNVSL